MNIELLKLSSKFTGKAFILFALTVISSCQPDLSDDPLRFQPFSTITVNLNLPEFQSLRTSGFFYINSGGIRGIILHRIDASTYVSYERNCSFHPNEACATVDVHTSNLYMIDPCCNSTFDFATGKPTGGPAWRPLAKYETLLTGSILTITDNVID